MTPLLHLLSIPVGYVYVVSLEWAIHRYVFHGIGKRWRPLGFHWHQHHRATLKHHGLDPSYDGSVFAWSAHGREFWAIVVAMLLHLPLLGVAPLGYITAVLAGLNYSRVHSKAHRDPDWCREHLPWHWDHHMGRDPDANWCVTNEWFDRLMGTRVLGPASQPRQPRHPHLSA